MLKFAGVQPGIRQGLASTCAIGALAAGFSDAACAQDASRASSGQTISEVIVTAQRRSERLVDVPAAVTAVTGEQLARSGVTSLVNIDQVSVGTKIVNFGVFLQPSIRGITTSVIGPGQENNIALYVDGFYLPDNMSLGGDLVNVEQVEVLKGPQGSLYGRAATGGAILMTTRGPSHTLTGDFTASYGNENDMRLQGFVAGPILENLTYSISGYVRRNDGYIKRDVVANGRIVPGDDGFSNPYKNDDVRMKLNWEATRELDFVMGYHYYRYSDASGLSSTPWQGFPPQLPPGPLREVQRDRIAPNIQPVDQTRGNEGTLAATWNTDVGALTSHTYYGSQYAQFWQDQDQTLVPFASSNAYFSRKTWSEALDFSSDKVDRLQLLAGLFWFWDKGGNHAFFENGFPLFLGTNNFINTATFTGSVNATLRTQSFAAYIDATYELIKDKLFLDVGVRYNHDKKSYEALLIGNTFVPSFNTNIPLSPVTVPFREATFDNVLPRANLRYQFNPNMNVYVSYSQGFKSGTFNALNTNPLPFATAPVEPETATSYEIGFKTHQSTYYVNVDAYWTLYKNLQVNTDINDPVLGLQAALLNAASARNYGIEVEGGWSPIANLNLAGGFAWTHARYREFPNDITPFQTFQDSSGLRIPRAADWTATLRADYTFHDVFHGSVNLAGNASYTSEYAPNLTVVGGPLNCPANPPASSVCPYTVPGPAGEQALVQGPYAILNLQATWTSDDGHYTATAFGENVTNERILIYSTAGTVSPVGAKTAPTYNRVYGRPAMYGIKVGYHF
jgi:iron complex outermembrane receptor protein